jgi:TetR/AcrR family transcriptional repressor of nem operon
MPRSSSTTGTKKQETHDKIVRTAAVAIRRSGYDGASVAAIMDEAGLTHGGFYAHFESRDAMLAEALDQGAAEALDRLGKASDGVAPGEALHAVVASYLSDRHLASPERGCTLAALGSETPRQTPEVRRVMTRRVRELASLLERQLPGWGEPGRHEEALGAMSAMVGAMVIARAIDDPALGKAVRAAAAKLIRTGTAAKK